MNNGPKHNIIYESDTPVAKALKRICNRKHMTQFELAVALKAGPKKLNNMINHNAYPDYSQMAILIKQFGVTTTDLFGPELAQKLKENEEKYLASKAQPSVGQTPEKYVSVTLACSKKPVVTEYMEPQKPEPKPEPVPEPVPETVKKNHGDARREGFVGKLAMLFSANK